MNLEQLKSQLTSLEQQYQQSIVQVHRVEGAILVTKNWIKLLEKSDNAVSVSTPDN